MYRSFAIIGHPDIIWSIVSSNCWQSYYYYYYYYYYYLLLHKIALSGPSDTALIYYYFSNTTCFDQADHQQLCIFNTKKLKLKVTM